MVLWTLARRVVEKRRREMTRIEMSVDGNGEVVAAHDAPRISLDREVVKSQTMPGPLRDSGVHALARQKVGTCIDATY